MFHKIAQGGFKKRILPGSDVKSTIPTLEPDVSSDYSRLGINVNGGRSYANDKYEEYGNRNMINEEVMYFRILVLNI